MHLHHMIPKHSSYFDYLGDVKENEYYKIYLTPEGHIEQHKVLYQVFGDNFDKIACNGLKGKNVKREVFSEAGKRGGKKKPSTEAKKKMRQAKLGKTNPKIYTEERNKKISEAKKNVKLDENHKKSISKSLVGNSRRKDGKKTWKPDDDYKKKMSEIIKQSWAKRKGLLD
jgi:hypothetical protein